MPRALPAGANLTSSQILDQSSGYFSLAAVTTGRLMNNHYLKHRTTAQNSRNIWSLTAYCHPLANDSHVASRKSAVIEPLVAG